MNMSDENPDEYVVGPGEEPEDIAKENQLITDLNSLPEDIRVMGAGLHQKRKKLAEIELLMAQIGGKISIEVSNEKDENGKNRYSNAEKREAEVEDRLSKHNDYQGYRITIENLKEEIAQDSLNLEFFNNRFKAARALALLAGSD